MMTRSIGDAAIKNLGGLTGEPDIFAYTPSENDIGLILFSDGVTDVLRSDEIIDCLKPPTSYLGRLNNPAHRIVKKA
jgi:serine/threonine protein phosphatase PrpC